MKYKEKTLISHKDSCLKKHLHNESSTKFIRFYDIIMEQMDKMIKESNTTIDAYKFFQIENDNNSQFTKVDSELNGFKLSNLDKMKLLAHYISLWEDEEKQSMHLDEIIKALENQADSTKTIDEVISTAIEKVNGSEQIFENFKQKIINQLWECNQKGGLRNKASLQTITIQDIINKFIKEYIPVSILSGEKKDKYNFKEVEEKSNIKVKGNKEYFSVGLTMYALQWFLGPTVTLTDFLRLAFTSNNDSMIQKAGSGGETTVNGIKIRADGQKVKCRKNVNEDEKETYSSGRVKTESDSKKFRGLFKDYTNKKTSEKIREFLKNEQNLNETVKNILQEIANDLELTNENGIKRSATERRFEAFINCFKILPFMFKKMKENFQAIKPLYHKKLDRKNIKIFTASEKPINNIEIQFNDLDEVNLDDIDDVFSFDLTATQDGNGVYKYNPGLKKFLQAIMKIKIVDNEEIKNKVINELQCKEFSEKSVFKTNNPDKDENKTKYSDYKPEIFIDSNNNNGQGFSKFLSFYFKRRFFEIVYKNGKIRQILQNNAYVFIFYTYLTTASVIFQIMNLFIYSFNVKVEEDKSEESISVKNFDDWQ